MVDVKRIIQVTYHDGKKRSTEVPPWMDANILTQMVRIQEQISRTGISTITTFEAIDGEVGA